MQIPLQITFRNLGKSEAIETRIRQQADKLERYYDRIMSCRVLVEQQHKHHRRGNHFHIRVDVTVPGGELVANREPDEHHAYKDVYVAIRDAFSAMRRQLEDYGRRQSGKVKVHEPPPHGRVIELKPEEDFGRIETPDGRLIYFHRNSLLDGDFDQLQLGAEVRFDEEEGDLGPKATTVHVIGKHHIAG